MSRRRYSLEDIKKDILEFLYDDEKKHWVYQQFKTNKDTLVDGKSVFYYQQMKVL